MSIKNPVPEGAVLPLSHYFAKDSAGKIVHVITTSEIEHARAAMVAMTLLKTGKELDDAAENHRMLSVAGTCTKRSLIRYYNAQIAWRLAVLDAEGKIL